MPQCEPACQAQNMENNSKPNTKLTLYGHGRVHGHNFFGGMPHGRSSESSDSETKTEK